jgi:hypothetical protein
MKIPVKISCKSSEKYDNPMKITVNYNEMNHENPKKNKTHETSLNHLPFSNAMKIPQELRKKPSRGGCPGLVPGRTKRSTPWSFMDF